MIERNKKIISFSLYGNNPKYIIGAVENAKLQLEIYPGWKCRFYIYLKSVPEDIIKKLFDLDCELIFKVEDPGEGQKGIGRFWRYEVLRDKNVERFIVRDTDSRLSERERICVDEWEKSGKNFHIIRDHRHHSARIMGGMWGATREVINRLDYDRLLDKFKFQNGNGKNQKFLAQMIYPVIKDDVIIHDNYHFFKDEKVLKIPSEKVNDHFIGEIIDV